MPHSTLGEPAFPAPTLRACGTADAAALGAIFGACFEDDPLYAKAIGFDPQQVRSFMTLVSTIMLADATCRGLAVEGEHGLVTAALAAPTAWQPQLLRHLARVIMAVPELGLSRLPRLFRALDDSDRQVPRRKNWCHLVYLGSLPEARGHGHGEALMNRLKASCKEAGYEAIYLETLLVNTGAIRFYERVGFERVQRISLLGVAHQQMVCSI